MLANGNLSSSFKTIKKVRTHQDQFCPPILTQKGIEITSCTIRIVKYNTIKHFLES